MLYPGKQLELYYRHARCENMLVVGTNTNRSKTLWLYEHVAMFQRLGWNFITVDLSGELGPYDLTGGTWSDIERRALVRLANPSVHVQTLEQMVNAIESLSSLIQQSQMSKTVLLHLGPIQPDISFMTTIVTAIRRLLAYQHGVWVVLPTIQALPMEFTTKLFHAHMILDRIGVKNSVLMEWASIVGVDLSDWTISNIQSIFVFNGRSEGAKGQVCVASDSDIMFN